MKLRDMNTAFFLRNEDKNPQWHVIDADGMVLGRLATKITEMLRGKNKAYYTPHTDSGDYIVVINAAKIKLTGNKLTDKEYADYSGWMGGLKIKTAQEVMEKYPERIIERAVKGMLPKNILSRYIMRKLRVYPGAEHPHVAQISKEQRAA